MSNLKFVEVKKYGIESRGDHFEQVGIIGLALANDDGSLIIHNEGEEPKTLFFRHGQNPELVSVSSLAYEP